MAHTSLAKEADSLVEPFRQPSTYVSLFIFLMLFVLLPLFILSFLERRQISPNSMPINPNVMGVSRTCTPEFVDWYADGKIDIQDYGEFVAMVNHPSPPSYADLNCDGVVNDEDLRIFTSNWSSRQR